MTDPSAMRRMYQRGRLDESAAAPTWLEQFQLWFADASDDPSVHEPNAMQLATVGSDGRPSARTVLLKGVDERGIVFYTNYDSAKGRDLETTPYAAVVFHWQTNERQVRLSGRAERVPREETEAYFATRPRGAQIGAWASPQSDVISSRAMLEDAVIELESRFAGADIPPPPNWGGIRIRPDVVEFWQGRADRLHDRLRYRRDGELWIVERLAP
ncbi:MAG TPA: pyridoxamine 5'-phosphate oxidase [Jatrophihabitantaceae bacterium]|nr:pyridoxamine 5'-phosphate oxidase [Jatrophihabitantaceae bacterium]